MRGDGGECTRVATPVKGTIYQTQERTTVYSRALNNLSFQALPVPSIGICWQRPMTTRSNTTVENLHEAIPWRQHVANANRTQHICVK